MNQTRCEWDNAESMALRLLQDRDINLRARLKDMMAHGQEKYDGCLVLPYRQRRLEVSAMCPIGCPKSTLMGETKTKGKHRQNARTGMAIKMEECIQGSGGIEAAKRLLTLRGNNQLFEVDCNSNMS